MLTKYDEYPIHQAVRPFSELPSTDLGWNDGYYFAIFNPELKIKLFWCLRVHPNSDVVHAWAGFVRNDRQRTVRFSRAWRPDCDTVIGPYGIDFIEAFRRIRLTLDANESDYSFDLEWLGIAPPHEEDRRIFAENGRRVTDQMRYVQEGTARGWFEIDGEHVEVHPGAGWGAFRDHSWGIYFTSPPIQPDPKWFPPKARTRAFEPNAHVEPGRLAFMTWNNIQTDTFSGIYWVYEDEDGVTHPVWTSPQAMQVGGALDFGWDGPRLHIVDVRHDFRFKEGTRVFAGGATTLTDENGGQWINEYERGGAPWLFYPCGPWPGAWRDGGTWATWHGEGVAMQWDEIDISNQPMDYQAAPDMPIVRDLLGTEYECKLRVTDPSGMVHRGTGHLELITFGRHKRYGFGEDFPPGGGSGGGSGGSGTFET